MALVSVVGCAAPSGDEGDPSAGPAEILTSDLEVLGTSEDIALVRDLEVLPDGRVWVLNSLPPYFIGFDPDGGVLAAYGVEGGGPEEFRLPAGFVTGGLDAEAWVLDLRRHALIRVSAPAEEWAEVPLPRDLLPPGTVQGGMDLMSPIVRTARLGDHVVLPHSTGSLETGLFSMIESILKADLMRLDPGTGEVSRLVRLGEALDDPFADFVPTAGGIPFWKRLWAVCGPDELRVYDRRRNQLLGFDAAGGMLPPVQLPAPRLDEVTRTEFARAVFPLRQAEITGGVGTRMSPEDSVRVINQMTRDVAGEPDELAAYFPEYVDFRCSEGGTMWLQPVDLDAGGLQGERGWLRIGAGGEPTVVTVPARFDPLRFTEERVWGVLRDEFDLASVASAALPTGPRSDR